jgi:hypothetical protein
MSKVFYRAVVFCSNPLTGFYCFEDRFQIFPLSSPHAPHSDKLKTNPVVIEYWIENATKPAPSEKELLPDIAAYKDMIHSMTQNVNYQKQILNLLSAVSNYRFYYPTPKLQWMAEVPDKKPLEGEPQPPSKPALSIYWYEQMGKEGQITGFTAQATDDVKRIKHPDCFQYIDVEGKETVQFSEQIDGAIHNYFALNYGVKDTVGASISLICNGLDLRNSMKSLSYVSLISSIETMVNHEFIGQKVEHCKACGQEQYKVMGKFRDYLLKYATDNEKTRKDINSIYSLRSKIAHAGLLLLGDNKIDWTNNKAQNDQWQTHILVMQIARLSLTNWLLMRGQSVVKQ